MMTMATKATPADVAAVLEAIGAGSFIAAGFILGVFEGLIAVGIVSWLLAVAIDLRRVGQEGGVGDPD